MSLDHNLFTLNFKPHEADATVTDLVDGAGVLQYQKQRVPGDAGEYRMNIYNPISHALLASATAPSPTSKVKIIQLHNPDSTTELKSVGTLTFRWSFQWEDHEFEWKREECYMIRKPDPPVLVAVTKEPAGRIKTSTMQLLDYNLNRFDIYDRKGLELVILTALMTFQDQSDTVHTPPAGSTSQRRMNSGSETAVAPVPPPKPPTKTGVDRIKELHLMRREAPNEVTVEAECTVEEWAQHCVNLILDDDMLFITLRSGGPSEVPKVMQVVDAAKRQRHKLGLGDAQELFQYVVHDTAPPSSPKFAGTGPRIIKLDDPFPDPSKGKQKDGYTPVEHLTVHLSKIPMPELQPSASSSTAARRASFMPSSSPPRSTLTGYYSPPSSSPSPHVTVPSSIKIDKKGKKKQSAHAKSDSSSSARLQKPNSPPRSSASPGLGVPSHHTHPNQPSPSPSQLNNPMIYVAPPPPRPPSNWLASSSSHGRFSSYFGNAAPPPGTPPPGPMNMNAGGGHPQYTSHVAGMPAPPPGPGYANPYGALRPGSAPPPSGPPPLQNQQQGSSNGPSGSVNAVTGLIDKLTSRLARV